MGAFHNTASLNLESKIFLSLSKSVIMGLKMRQRALYSNEGAQGLVRRTYSLLLSTFGPIFRKLVSLPFPTLVTGLSEVGFDAWVPGLPVAAGGVCSWIFR